jgi:hypothetical protein
MHDLAAGRPFGGGLAVCGGSGGAVRHLWQRRNPAPASIPKGAVLCTGMIGTRLPQLGAAQQPWVAVEQPWVSLREPL